MGTAMGAALIGRSQELQRLRSALSDLREGRGGIVLLEGEAGTGKTRLLAAFLEEAAAIKGIVCAGAAALDYAPAPYAVVRDFLTSLDDAMPKVLARDAGLRAQLAPIMQYGSSEAEAGAEQRRLLDGVADALQHYAGAAPVVAAIEDIHWIDRASADVFVHLARVLARVRVLLILTYRTTESAADESSRHLLGQLSRAASQTVLLRPLSGPDALLLVDDLAPASLPLTVRRTICQLAEGNPLLVAELTKYASENPDKLLTSLPLSLQALVAERLERFDPRDVDVLRVAAAMGEFDPRAVAQIAGVDETVVMTTLRKARDASIVGETGNASAPFLFRHALIRRAITDRLFEVERQALHARIAEYLLPHAGEAGIDNRLAYHYWIARDTANAEKFNLLAGDEAMRLGAYHDAVRFFERALAARPLCDETYELHLRLARAYFATRANEAEPLLVELFSFCKSKDLRTAAVEAAFDLSRQRYHMLDDTGMIAAVRDGLALCNESVPVSLVFDLHSTLAWYLVHLRDLAGTREELERAGRLLESAQPEARMRYYEVWAMYDVHSGELLKWREYFQSALDELPRVSPYVALTRLSNMIALAMSSYIEDDDFIESLFDRARRIGDTGVKLSQWPHIELQIAWHRYLHGRLVEARAALDDALCEEIDVPIRLFWFARVGIVLGVRTHDPLLLHRCTRAGFL
ncbi:MAG: AAA family ATPase, partial [Candidatus Eremiobacteraeota bacterium]|nr:AAA family ATPase [Candidatus Eremiobacteraeota bacterium]